VVDAVRALVPEPGVKAYANPEPRSPLPTYPRVIRSGEYDRRIPTVSKLHVCAEVCTTFVPPRFDNLPSREMKAFVASHTAVSGIK
jgi:hypothetical protein